MKSYKRFILVKYYNTYDLMLVRKQPNKAYPTGGLGLILNSFDERFKPQNNNPYILRTVPINGMCIIGEDNDLYKLISKYVYPKL